PASLWLQRSLPTSSCPSLVPPINNKSAPRPPSGAGDGTCALSASASIVRRGQARHKSVRRCTRTIGGGIVRQHSGVINEFSLDTNGRVALPIQGICVLCLLFSSNASSRA